MKRALSTAPTQLRKLKRSRFDEVLYLTDVYDLIVETAQRDRKTEIVASLTVQKSSMGISTPR